MDKTFWLRKRIIIPGVVLFGITCVTTGALASSSIRALTAYINEQIGITIDGREYVPKEDDNTIIDPLIYNNRTYLPVAKIGEALNVDVDWTAATQTVGIWTEAGKELRPTKDTSGDSETTKNTTKPLVNWDDSKAAVKNGMSSYNFDKAFAEIHSLGMVESELKDKDKLHQFIFQAIKEAWNESPTTHKIKHPALYSTDLLNSLNSRHASYKEGNYKAVLSVDEKAGTEYPILRTKKYSFTGEAVKSTNGGQLFIRVGIKGNMTLKTDKKGKVTVEELTIQEMAKLPNTEDIG